MLRGLCHHTYAIRMSYLWLQWTYDSVYDVACYNAANSRRLISCYNEFSTAHLKPTSAPQLQPNPEDADGKRLVPR